MSKLRAVSPSNKLISNHIDPVIGFIASFSVQRSIDERFYLDRGWHLDNGPEAVAYAPDKLPYLADWIGNSICVKDCDRFARQQLPRRCQTSGISQKPAYQSRPGTKQTRSTRRWTSISPCHFLPVQRPIKWP